MLDGMSQGARLVRGSLRVSFVLIANTSNHQLATTTTQNPPIKANPLVSDYSTAQWHATLLLGIPLGVTLKLFTEKHLTHF